MFQQIVVPLDESRQAEEALPMAAHIARASGGSILLLRVVTFPTDSLWESRDREAVFHEITEKEYSRAETYLQQIAHSGMLSGVEVKTEVASRHPASRILEVSKENNADLIVLCRHGSTGAKHWMMGNVARQIVRHSPVPVLLLHPTSPTFSSRLPEKQSALSVMVPLDGSLLAEEALPAATFLCTQLSQPLQGTLHLISLFPHRNLERVTVTEGDQAMLDAQDYLATIKYRLHQQEDLRSKLSITTAVMSVPDIAHALVEHAETDKESEQGQKSARSDIIVMATHGRGGIAHWIMGSVAERVLEATKLPLLIVRPHTIGGFLHEEKHDMKQKTIDRQQKRAESSWVGLL